MKILYKIFNSFLVIGLLFSFGCTDDPAPTLADLPPGNKPTPIITSIDPPNVALAGVTVLTITGTNFAPGLADSNIVSFNGTKGTVLSATTTQLIVKAPIVVADTVIVKVASYKSENFSNKFQYKLLTAQEEYYVFNPNKDATSNVLPYAFMFNNSQDMLVSIKDIGIKKITTNLTLNDYIPAGTASKWDCLKFGPANQIYGSRSVRAIWKLNEGVAPSSAWATTTAGSIVKDIEFDANNNLWAIGSSIFRVKQDLTITAFSFVASLRSARFYNGSLYVAGLKGNTEGIWKIPILPNGDLNLNAQELYFDLGQSYVGRQALSITFAADGDLIVGTNNGDLNTGTSENYDPLIVVHPNKSSEILYPGVIPAGKAIYLYWSPNSNSLYFTRELKTKPDPTGTKTLLVYSQTVIRVEMQKPGAVYHGQ